MHAVNCRQMRLLERDVGPIGEEEEEEEDTSGFLQF